MWTHCADSPVARYEMPTSDLLCATCTDAKRVQRCCPDLGLKTPPGQEYRIGGLGNGADAPWKFDACPEYWKREPWQYECANAWSVDGQSTAAYAAMRLRWLVDHGNVSLGEYPAKAEDAVMLLWTESSRLSALREKRAAEQARKENQKLLGSRPGKNRTIKLA